MAFKKPEKKLAVMWHLVTRYNILFNLGLKLSTKRKKDCYREISEVASPNFDSRFYWGERKPGKTNP
ncbi:MAG: hypothetical protein CM15mV43_400 [uncultured marine virus]|nr:MAG: hypothetical protein CM15mV43_400 [uncultured marine virus]